MKHNFLFILLLAITLLACGQNKVNEAEHTWIYDYEEVLNKEQENLLDSIVNSYEYETTNEIAIVTVTILGSLTKWQNMQHILETGMELVKKTKIMD